MHSKDLLFFARRDSVVQTTILYKETGLRSQAASRRLLSVSTFNTTEKAAEISLKVGGQVSFHYEINPLLANQCLFFRFLFFIIAIHSTNNCVLCSKKHQLTPPDTSFVLSKRIVGSSPLAKK